MFQIEMLPAREGDCLWVRYGNVSAPHQILIDGGRQVTYLDLKARLMELPEFQRQFELFVITHIDRDHIEGAISLLEDPDLKLSFRDIWFNGYGHLKGSDLESFGAAQGERLSSALRSHRERWNAAFGGGPVRIATGGSLPRFRLAGGLELTLLSPDGGKLTSLLPRWEAECAKAGLEPGNSGHRTEPEGLESFGGTVNVEKLAAQPFRPDRTVPNGSSIALLAEFNGARVLLAGDAHADRLISSLKVLLREEGRLRLDAFKLSHHGSSGNTSRELLDLVECSRYLVSTNGSYFGHPDEVAIARVLKYGGSEKSLHFNYSSDRSSVWMDAVLQQTYCYTMQTPSEATGGLVVSLQD
ncbi:hypothetical protein NJG17_10175 [Stenotrophomonas maltophilia]|uniref:ComEC/Rec2 family competence protein n=1 Tax=Stenotrophomonas maltophilia TaxID=40324 RepID=UPI00209B6613|nr:hypothetical protein [Stenotrophomonas maltophilia]MCO7500265.1 hypothetical protein [Stenotrophomonas maltophilia]